MTRRVAELRSLVDEYDAGTSVLSGGFEHHELFADIVSVGEPVLPVLYERGEGIAWAQFQAIGTIAAQLERPIEVPERARGNYHAVRRVFLAWGFENGYLRTSAGQGR